LRQIEFLFDNSDDDIDGDGDPDLCLYGVRAIAPEGLDLEVLFDPLEEQFYLPSVFIELCDFQWRKIEVVGQKDKRAILLGIVELYSSQVFGTSFGGIKARKTHNLVTSKPGSFVHGRRIDSPKVEIPQCTGNKERP